MYFVCTISNHSSEAHHLKQNEKKKRLPKTKQTIEFRLRYTSTQLTKRHAIQVLGEVNEVEKDSSTSVVMMLDAAMCYSARTVENNKTLKYKETCKLCFKKSNFKQPTAEYR